MWTKLIYNVVKPNESSETFYYDSSQFPSILRYNNNGKNSLIELSKENAEEIQFLAEGLGGFMSQHPGEAKGNEYTLLVITEEANGVSLKHDYYYWYGDPLGPKVADSILESFQRWVKH